MSLCPVGLCSATSICFVQFYAAVVTIWLVCEMLLPMLWYICLCCWKRRNGRCPEQAALIVWWL